MKHAIVRAAVRYSVHNKHYADTFATVKDAVNFIDDHCFIKGYSHFELLCGKFLFLDKPL